MRPAASPAAQVQVVLPLGEYAHDAFADHGWIVDFKTGRRVWEMAEANTQHAGGAEKNVFADEMITLSPGDYVAYYMTDDSHAYMEWNQPPPNDPTHWGITIEARGADADTDAFRTFDTTSRRGRQGYCAAGGVGSKNTCASASTDAIQTCTCWARRGSATRLRYAGEDPEERRTVWEMTVRNTNLTAVPKERTFEDPVRLVAGRRSPLVTDGSPRVERLDAARA